jgi:hypothetical protein
MEHTIVIVGRGGVGKSAMVVSALKWLKKILKNESDSIDSQQVCVTIRYEENYVLSD